jgi:hypothetical protein
MTSPDKPEDGEPTLSPAAENIKALSEVSQVWHIYQPIE